MFKNDFQGNPFFEIFSSNGTLSKNWKFVNRTYIGKTYDSQVKGYCYSCDKIGRISLPKEKLPLYLIQPFLNIQIYIPQGSNFSLELLISDLSGARRRFFLSTAQLETKINALHVNLPIPGLIRGKWINVTFDLASIVSETFRNQVFKSLNGLTLCGTFKLRKIFTLKYRPPDSSGGEAFDYDYANRHIESIPRAVSFPIGVENIAQIYNMNRILITNSHASQNPSSTTDKGLLKLPKINNRKVLHGPKDTDSNIHAFSTENIAVSKRLNKTTILNHLGNPKAPISSKIRQTEKISQSDSSGLHKNHPVHTERRDHDHQKFLSTPVTRLPPIIPHKEVYDPILYSNGLNEAGSHQNESLNDFQNCGERDLKEIKIQNTFDGLNIPDSYQKLHNRQYSGKETTDHNHFCDPSPHEDDLEPKKHRSESDEELQSVTKSFDKLLCELKHDSETTLFPTVNDTPQSKAIKRDDKQDGSEYYSSSDQASEDNLELIFDIHGSSFVDPMTGKSYFMNAEDDQ